MALKVNPHVQWVLESLTEGNAVNQNFICIINAHRVVIH